VRGRYAVRLLALAGGMLVACENASDARASKARDGRPATVAQTISNGDSRRDSISGFTVPVPAGGGGGTRRVCPLRIGRDVGGRR